MAQTLDTIINWGVPLLVIGFLFFLFYQQFKSTFDFALDKIKWVAMAAASSVTGKTKDKAKDVYEVVYTYGK
jgi:hypothetical protein